MHRQHETVTQIAPAIERLRVCVWVFILSMALFATGVVVGFGWAAMYATL